MLDKVVMIVDRCQKLGAAESLVYLGAKELRKVGVTVAEWIPGIRGYRSAVRNQR